MNRIDIPTGEIGTTRVFSLSMPPAQARALRKSSEAQFAILGSNALNAEGLEVFPLTDLGDIGLIGYLREGTDAVEVDLKRDSAKLAALDGWVMLVHSLAFGGAGGKIDPDPALTLIGTYAQAPMPTTHVEVTSEAAQPYTGGADIVMPKAPNRQARGSIVVVALLAIAALIFWWALT